MSHFYGTLKGSRGQATRCGTKDSGIMASAQSWDGSITVYIEDSYNTTNVSICSKEGSGAGGRLLWSGPLSDLLHDKAKITVGCTK